MHEYAGLRVVGLLGDIAPEAPRSCVDPLSIIPVDDPTWGLVIGQGFG